MVQSTGRLLCSLCREDGGPRLSEVGQGSSTIKSARGRTGLHLLAENIHRLVEGKTAGWFQQLADQIDVQRDQTVDPSAAFRAAATPAATTSAAVRPEPASLCRLAPKVLA